MVAGFRKWFVISITIFVITFLLILVQEQSSYYEVYPNISKYTINHEEDEIIERFDFKKYNNGQWRNLSLKQQSQLSTLGRILYLNENLPENNTDFKKYKILIWKYGPTLENRHMQHFTDHKFDPFENCSVKNCKITYKDADLQTADLVIFHLHRTKSVQELPVKKRNPKQIWAFLTDESPFHTFLHTKDNKLKMYNGIFNWSMTYRMDSDIPVPYGRTLLLENDEKPKEISFEEWNQSKKQDVLIAIMGSNCGGKNHRWEYVKELKKHIAVDTYGACGTLKCPGHFTKDCEEISKYKFYLSFENSNCNEYITEKLWWNGYAKNAIPIVMGSSKLIYKQLLPPNSYINVEDFASPRDLANYIIYLNKTTVELKRYFTWKKHFKIVNEHGYFQTPSYHYCRACEALNYNDKNKVKVYDNLKQFWSKNDCHESWDAQVY